MSDLLYKVNKFVKDSKRVINTEKTLVGDNTITKFGAALNSVYSEKFMVDTSASTYEFKTFYGDYFAVSYDLNGSEPKEGYVRVIDTDGFKINSVALCDSTTSTVTSGTTKKITFTDARFVNSSVVATYGSGESAPVFTFDSATQSFEYASGIDNTHQDYIIFNDGRIDVDPTYTQVIITNSTSAVNGFAKVYEDDDVIEKVELFDNYMNKYTSTNKFTSVEFLGIRLTNSAVVATCGSGDSAHKLNVVSSKVLYSTSEITADTIYFTNGDRSFVQSLNSVSVSTKEEIGENDKIPTVGKVKELIGEIAASLNESVRVYDKIMCNVVGPTSLSNYGFFAYATIGSHNVSLLPLITKSSDEAMTFKCHDSTTGDANTTIKINGLNLSGSDAKVMINDVQQIIPTPEDNVYSFTADCTKGVEITIEGAKFIERTAQIKAKLINNYKDNFIYLDESANIKSFDERINIASINANTKFIGYYPKKDIIITIYDDVNDDEHDLTLDPYLDGASLGGTTLQYLANDTRFDENSFKQATFVDATISKNKLFVMVKDIAIKEDEDIIDSATATYKATWVFVICMIGSDLTCVNKFEVSNEHMPAVYLGANGIAANPTTAVAYLDESDEDDKKIIISDRRTYSIAGSSFICFDSEDNLFTTNVAYNRHYQKIAQSVITSKFASYGPYLFSLKDDNIIRFSYKLYNYKFNNNICIGDDIPFVSADSL